MPKLPVARIGTDQAFFSFVTFELVIGPGTLRVFCWSAPGNGHSPAVAAPGLSLLPDATLTPATAIALIAATTATLVAAAYGDCASLRPGGSRQTQSHLHVKLT